jgi:hypothetical protein
MNVGFELVKIGPVKRARGVSQLAANGSAKARDVSGAWPCCEKLCTEFLLEDTGPLQFIAQQRRIAAKCGESCCSSAFLQQSIIIPDSGPPECSETPANTLPANAAIKIEDVIHLMIAIAAIMRTVKRSVK